MPLKKSHHRKYADLASVESQQNDLTAEEFPEGPYGSDQTTESLGKSAPWREGQRPPGPFAYENRDLHEGMSRNYPGDHETHDNHRDESPVD